VVCLLAIAGLAYSAFFLQEFLGAFLYDVDGWGIAPEVGVVRRQGDDFGLGVVV
jgi:hypothetical protein